jgi:predicted SAM-dependent methyltransferase
MELRWSEEKARLLKEGRNIDVLFLAKLFSDGQYIDSFPNSKNPHQTIFIFNVNNYALVVICVVDSENESGLFLKTAYYNRNYTEFYKLRSIT